jgi:hypothetical protein
MSTLFRKGTPMLKYFVSLPGLYGRSIPIFHGDNICSIFVHSRIHKLNLLSMGRKKHTVKNKEGGNIKQALDKFCERGAGALSTPPF